MAKGRRTLGTTGSPVTSDAQTGNSGLNNIQRAAQGSSLYQENIGATDVGGRLRPAGFANDYFRGKLLGADTGEVTEAYKGMGIDFFNPFSNNNDYEKIRKDNQSAAVAYTNLAGQFVAKTALNTIGGVVGSFYGIGSALVNQDATKLIDNSFMRGIDSASESVDELAPVFTSQSDKEKGVFGMFSGLETMKSVSDAFAFTAGAVLTEAIMQTAGNAVTGGAAELGVGARIARYAARAGVVFGEESAVGRRLVQGSEYIGLGDKLKRIGERAELASVLLKDVDNPATRAIIEKAAMAEGIGLEQMQKYMQLSQKIDNTLGGIRKVMSGSFYEGTMEGRQAKDTMMQNAEVTIDAQLNSEGLRGEDREKEKERRLALAESDANALMGITTALNVGLLGASNALQFPTLFGMKSFPATKGLNNMSSFITRDAATGVASAVTKSTAAKIGGKVVKVLEHPFEEFMEETLQGSISKGAVNFHDRLTNVNSRNAGLEHPFSEFASDLWKGMEEQYGSKEGIEEGLIGAIVGGLGAPSFKRNDKGKIRPTIEGGILDALKGRSKEELNRIQEALDVMKSDTQFQAMKYNVDQTKINSFNANEENKAIENEDEVAFESAGTDKVFQHVANYLDKGLKDHLEEETEALKKLTPEQYTAKTREPGSEIVTKEQMDKELNDYFGKVNTYKAAYEKVFKSMRMDKMNDNKINQRLLNHIAYAVAKDKEELKQFDNQSKELRGKGLKMTETELYALALMHGKIGTLTNKELEDELSRFDNEEHPEYLSKIEKLAQEEYDALELGSEIINKRKVSKKLQDIKDKYGLDHAAFSRVLAKKYKAEKVEDSQFTPEFFEDKTRKENRKRTDFDYKFKEELKKKINEKVRAENEYKKEDYTKSREELLDENAKIVERNMKLNKEAADKFQQKQSAAMDHLAGKQKRVTLKDIQDYKDSLEKYKEQLTADETVPRSFLDQIDNLGSKDINKALDKLAGTISRREASLRVAANLYGLEGVNKAVQAVANAELVTNYNNNKYFRNALKHFLTNGGKDDSGAEAALAYKQLELSSKSLREITDNFKKMITNQEVQNNNDLVKHLEKEIEMSNDLLEEYVEYTENEDAKEKAIDKASKKDVKSSEKIGEKIKKEKIKFSQEEVDAAMEINNLVLQHGELVNKPKQSWGLYTNSQNSKRDDNLRKLVEDGSVGMNNVVYFKPQDFNELNQGMTDSMNEKQRKLFERGRELFQENPTIIGDKDVMDINKFMVDGKLEFDESDSAAVQFFVMSFPVTKEITNDISIPLPDGTKQIIDKKDDRIVSSSFLYSPYFAFDKTSDNADAFVFKLNEDKKTIAALTKELGNKNLTKIEKIDLKREIDLLQISVTARELRANDATLYELRKQILMGSTIHKNSSEKDEEYSMRALIRDFNYGNVSEHTLNGEKLPQGEYNNFPLINTGEINKENFDDNSNFLSDATSIQELFDQDKLALCYQDRNLVYLKSNNKISFDSKESTEDTESKNESGESKELEVKENDTTKEQYTVGAMYYMHETKTGVLVPVKLNMQTISSSDSVMNGLEKHINASIEVIKAREKDHEKTLRIYDEPIILEQGEFEGMFDNDPDAPKTLHKLLEYFLPHYNSKKDADMPLMVYKTGERDEVQNNSDVTSVDDELEEDPLLQHLKDTVPENVKEKASSPKSKLHVDFGTEKKAIKDFTANDLQEIMNNIGSMRFYFKKHLSINQSKPQDEKLTKPNVLSFAFTSGLITHGFDVVNNVEKIYSPFESLSETGGEKKEKQVGIMIVPMDSDVLGKTKRILGNAYAGKTKKQLFSPSLRNVFKFDTKYNKEHKIVFDLKAINRQMKYLIDKRFEEIVKERGIDKNSTEEERRLAYKDAVESRIAMFKSELKSIEEKFGNKDRENLLKLINLQVDKFEKQFKDPKNASIFKAIYTNKTKKEYFNELNGLLFTSDELNNELSSIMPTLTRPSANSSIVFNSKEEGMTLDKLKNIVAAIDDHNELSKRYKEAGGKDFLPIDIKINSLEKEKNNDNFNSIPKRYTTYLDEDGIPKTELQPAESIKINSKDTFFYQDNNGKISKLNPEDIDKVFKFDKNGKMTDGIMFLNITGYKKGKFVVLAVGSNTLKENKSNSVRDNGENTFRYVSGINFHRHNKDLSLNKKENNAIENVLSEKEKSKDATSKLYAKLNPTKTAEDNFQEAMDDAMRIKEEAEQDAQEAFEKIKKEGKSSRATKTSMRKKEEVDSDSIDEALKQASLLRKGKNDLRWIIDELAPDIEDSGDLEKYDPSVIMDWKINGLDAVKSIDFTNVSDKETINFINKQPDGPGAAKELFLEAMKNDSVRAKSALNEMIKTISDKAKPKKKNVMEIAEQEVEGSETFENAVWKKEVVETRSVEGMNVSGLFDANESKQLKRVVKFNNQETINNIVEKARQKPSAGGSNNNIFVSAAVASSTLASGKIENNKGVHMIAKAVYGSEYSENGTNKAIEEYNKNCSI